MTWTLLKTRRQPGLLSAAFILSRLRGVDGPTSPEHARSSCIHDSRPHWAPWRTNFLVGLITPRSRFVQETKGRTVEPMDHVFGEHIGEQGAAKRKRREENSVETSTAARR